MSYFDKYYWSLINRHQPFLRLEDGREDLVLLEDGGRIELDVLDESPSFTAYINRVVEDGGYIGSGVECRQYFDFLDNYTFSISNVYGMSVHGGKRLDSNQNVEKFYALIGEDTVQSIADRRPTKNFFFDGVDDNSGFVLGSTQSNTEISFFVQTGTWNGSTGDSQYLFGNYFPSSSPTYFEVFFNASDELRIIMAANATGVFQNINTGITAASNLKIYFTASIVGTTLTVNAYVDGVSVFSNTYTTARTTILVGTRFVMGNFPNPIEGYNGQIISSFYFDQVIDPATVFAGLTV